MADIQALKDELDGDPLGRGYSTMTDQQVADVLNAQTRQQTVPIPVDEVKRYLFVNDLWFPIKNGTDQVAEAARDAIGMFDQFRVNESDVATKVDSLLSNLVSAGYATSSDKVAVQALGVQTQSRAQELSLLGASPEIGPAHVQQARAL